MNIMLKMCVIILMLAMAITIDAKDTAKMAGCALGASALGGYVGRKMAPIHECKFPPHTDPLTQYTIRSLNHFDNKIVRFKWSLNGVLSAGIITYLLVSFSKLEKGE
jgi:hypothetical protein